MDVSGTLTEASLLQPSLTVSCVWVCEPLCGCVNPLCKVFRDPSLVLLELHNLNKTEMTYLGNSIGPQTYSWVKTAAGLVLHDSCVLATTVIGKAQSKVMNDLIDEFPLWIKDESKATQVVESTQVLQYRPMIDQLIASARECISQWDVEALDYMWQLIKQSPNIFYATSILELGQMISVIIRAYCSLEGVPCITKDFVDHFFAMFKEIMFTPATDFAADPELITLKNQLLSNTKKVGKSINALVVEFVDRLESLDKNMEYSERDMLSIATSIIQESGTTKHLPHQLLTLINDQGHILKSSGGYKVCI
eukprot:Blabericola_migrator_1__3545@NODE_2052_length_3356_cov_89_705990_g1302_i0_p1_GENE_NODE_2052_length_3356_cov_89_705990_g1302_i0NODE_2052_length_3356_cov_89_705990_g1302_i0_p1_ORF_typecomplete_len308_score63_79DUF816/PF05674_12/0_06_NODE_2052_length_3356_cov_89_705990_g1302_i013782301